MIQVNLKTSSKTVVMFIVITSVVFVGCLLGYFVIAGEIKEASNELKSKETEVASSQEKAQELERSKLDFVDIRSQLKNLEASMPSQAYIPTMLKQIELLGKSVNLKVISVEPIDKEEKSVEIDPIDAIKRAFKDSDRIQKIVETKLSNKPESTSKSSSDKTPSNKNTINKNKIYDCFIFNIAVEGNYANTLNFIYKITNFPKIMAVSSISLSPNETTNHNGSPNLRSTIKLRAYILKNDKSDAHKDLVASAAKNM